MIQTEPQHIDVATLFQRMNNNPHLCLIDVREPHEWQMHRIPGATLIPQGELNHQIQLHVPNQQQPIYLHCHLGRRSWNAALALVQLGYQAIYSVDGGISAWMDAGYPIEQG